MTLEKDHDYFNLDSMIADMIELSKPFHPLCNDNCKGLCPKCGQDLNCKVCGCKIGTSNNPFEKLKTLQIPKTQHSILTIKSQQH